MSIYKDDHRNITHSLVLSCVKDGAAFLMEHLNVTNGSLCAPQLGPRVCIDLYYASSARAIEKQPPSAAPLKNFGLCCISSLSLSSFSLSLSQAYVHCKAGRGRSTAVAVAYMLNLGYVGPVCICFKFGSTYTGNKNMTKFTAYIYGRAAHTRETDILNCPRPLSPRFTYHRHTFNSQVQD